MKTIFITIALVVGVASTVTGAGLDQLWSIQAGSKGNVPCIAIAGDELLVFKDERIEKWSGATGKPAGEIVLRGSALAVSSVNGNIIAGIRNNGNILAFNKVTGKVLWEQPGFANASIELVIHDGILYVASGVPRQGIWGFDLATGTSVLAQPMDDVS